MSTKNRILFGFILIKIIFHYFLIDPGYDLHRDEYLHLDQGKHLDWGYMSLPPLTSFFSYIILILGNGTLWVKFFPAVFGALTILVVWKTIEALKGNLFALILGATSILFSAILRLNILYQPNSFDILAWTTFYFSIVKYIQSEHSKWLYFSAVIFAIGFLNKYNVVFLILGLLPALLLTTHRTLFLKKHFYFSMALALVIISPNLIWQYKNDFPVFHHLNELAKTQLENVNRGDFLKAQVLFFFGSLFVLLAAFISFFSYQPFKKYVVFFWSFVFTLFIFVYFKAKGYYAVGLYPILIAFGSTYIGELLNEKWKLYVRPVALLLPIVLFLPFLKVVFPINSPEVIQQKIESYKKLGMLRWEDGKEHNLPQDFADMLGWKELAHKVDSAYYTSPEGTLVLCDNYGQAGAINYYSKIPGMQAVSFNADYINWIPLDSQIKNIILIKESKNAEIDKKKKSEQFELVLKFDAVTHPYAREYGTTIFLLKNAKTDINSLLKKGIAEEKKDHN